MKWKLLKQFFLNLLLSIMSKEKDGTAPAKKATTEKAKPTAQEAENARANKAEALAVGKEPEGAKLMAQVAQEAETYGDKEIGEVMDLAESLVSAYRSAKADGTINQADFPFVIDPLTKILPALQGAGMIGKEWKDIDEEEKARQVAKFGRIARNPKYTRLFRALVDAGDAITEIVTEGQTPA